VATHNVVKEGAATKEATEDTPTILSVRPALDLGETGLMVYNAYIVRKQTEMGLDRPTANVTASIDWAGPCKSVLCNN
jgi:hypothetical protein